MAGGVQASVPAFARNPVSVAGAWLTTISAFAFIAYYAAEWLELFVSPYSGLLGFVVIPVFFVVGLLLIPIGMWREARRRRRGIAPWQWPAIDLGRSHTRRVALAIVGLTIVNIGIVAVAGLGAVHYMETDSFCGQVCHEPMRPQFTAHTVAPHAQVNCVQCHVAPGAAGMVRAKMNGTRQLISFVTGHVPRPIPSSPARNIPVAADTCMRCHDATRPMRDIVKTTYEYDEDEANSEKVTNTVHFTSKDHWHTQSGRVVEYVATDPKRGTIPYVKVTEADGKTTEYFAEGATSAPAGERRQMDCLDCHSRPAHRFAPSVEQAVDAAIGGGQVDKSLPFVRREMVQALKATYPSDAAADEAIRTRLTSLYKSDASKAQAAQQAAAAAARLYATNVFPDMKITWGTYLSHIGHTDTDGCFRCHDDEHKTKDGRAIKQDCELCHKDQ
jgi:hypothetical protein